MTIFALLFLISAVSAGTIGATYTITPLFDECVAVGSSIQFQSTVDSTYSGNTLTYEASVSIEGGAAANLAQPNCLTSIASVSGGLVVVPKFYFTFFSLFSRPLVMFAFIHLTLIRPLITLTSFIALQSPRVGTWHPPGELFDTMQSGGCEAGPTPVTLTAVVAPEWAVEYDCATGQLVFSGAGLADLTEYKVEGVFEFQPIANPSGSLIDTGVAYTVVVKYGTCEDSKQITVSCVHHCALSPGYWKQAGSWFTNACQFFSTAEWCGWSYWSLLTQKPSSIAADSKAKFIAGRQYVAFILTMYYYSDPMVDVRTYSVADLEALGIPTPVAEAVVALQDPTGCSLTPEQYGLYGSAIALFNNHEVDETYVENVECDPKILEPSCTGLKRSLLKQLRLKK